MTDTAPNDAASAAPIPVDLSRFNVLCETKYGTMLANKHDVYVGTSLLRYGQFSEGEAELFRALIPVGGVVIEAGANIGALTVPIAQHVGRDGLVLAYEPQRLAFQLLNANVALNCLTNVITRQVALGASVGMIPVPMVDPYATANVGGFEIRGHSHGEPVPLKRLDDYGELPRLDFLKADVEGMELSVLLGANRLLTTHWPTLYLEADRQDKQAALVGTMVELGYRLYLHTPPLFSPDNWNHKPDNIFIQNDQPVVSINLLGIHESRETPPEISGISNLRPLGQALREAAAA
jgi:FkbM family methyltransferase